MSQQASLNNGGRFDFDDGGTYVGGWDEGKAHGHGVCTGPQAKGEYAGAWHYGFEVSGVYRWPSGNAYEGQWQNGKMHGLGVEYRGKGIYRGEWTQGLKGRYGVRQSTVNPSRYQGTWQSGMHDGYGTETYVDGGTYQGQWLRGMRHGYGIRKSSTYEKAVKSRSRNQAHASMSSLRSIRPEDEQQEEEHPERPEIRGGFVLRASSAAPQRRRRSLSERSLAVKRTILTGLRLQKQHSTGDIHQRVSSAADLPGSLRSSGSTMSCTSDDSIHRGHLLSPEEDPVDENVTETYMGEWKNDTRSGFGVCERSDGLRYCGEWSNNAKSGYGITTLRDGTKEEGKYKNNVLIVSARRRGALFVRSSKIRERVEASADAANRAASIAQQKADIAASRTSTARERAEQASYTSNQAKIDAELARNHAMHYDPNFKPIPEVRRHRLYDGRGDSFNTDGSDQMSYSRHISGPHSAQASFEQNLSMDLPDTAFLTPLAPQPPQLIGNHVGHGHVNAMGNHVGYAQSRVTQTMEEMPSTSSSRQTEELPSSSLLDQVVEVADDIEPSSSGLQNQEPHSELKLQHNAQMASRFSLSDDHYDQYVMAGGTRIRRNRPSLMRQSDVNDASILNRRSTLASDRDRRAEPTTELTAENMGSLPNLAELETTGVRIRREDAARLASQRRQEVLRDQEDQALLRANPLRYLTHPAFRAWLSKWKVPLLLAAANMSLLCLFYYLLTYEKKRSR